LATSASLGGGEHVRARLSLLILLPSRPNYPSASLPSTPRERESERDLRRRHRCGRPSFHIRALGCCRGVAPLIPHVVGTSRGTDFGGAALDSSPELAPSRCSALRRGLLLPVARTLGKSLHRARLCFLFAWLQLIERGSLSGRISPHHPWCRRIGLVSAVSKRLRWEMRFMPLDAYPTVVIRLGIPIRCI
jgi:hypothetical protein